MWNLSQERAAARRLEAAAREIEAQKRQRGLDVAGNKLDLSGEARKNKVGQMLIMCRTSSRRTIINAFSWRKDNLLGWLLFHVFSWLRDNLLGRFVFVISVMFSVDGGTICWVDLRFFKFYIFSWPRDDLLGRSMLEVRRNVVRASETSRTHGESSCDQDRDKNQRNKQMRQIIFGRPSSDQQKFKIKYIYNVTVLRKK